VPYVIWISIELNVVMITASIPILRPLFSRQLMARLKGMQKKPAQYTESGVDLGQTGVMLTNKKPRVGVQRLHSSSSEEDILPAQAQSSQDPLRITRTVEVTVTQGPNNVVFVHAALVGLPTN